MKNIKSVFSKRWRNLAHSSLAVVLLSLFSVNAQAITIGGNEYEKIFSAELDGYFGVWRYYQKGSTFTVHPTDLTVGVRSPQYFGDLLDGVEAPNRLVNMFMIPTVDYSGPLVSSTFEITGARGNTLLSLDLSGFGSLSTTRALGDAGEAKLTGLFEVTGGSWLAPGMQVFAALSYSKGYGYERNDYYWTDGTFQLFAREQPPVSEVPEPATLGLLTVGLLGVARRRKLALRNDS